MCDRNSLALALYAKWIIEADGELDLSLWTTDSIDDWKYDRPLNSFGLTKKNFLEEADYLMDLVNV